MEHVLIRFQVGSLACTVFADSTGLLTENRVANIFAKDIDQHGDRVLTAFRALPEAPEMSQNILYIENAGQRVLIDAGEGSLIPGQSGKLLEQMHSEGIAPETIDMVILTHFHLDHIGGLLNAAGNANFSKARLAVPRPEYDYWLNPSSLIALVSVDPDRAKLLQCNFDAYASAGGVVPLDENAEIMPGIRYIAAFGHTPGQCGVMLESEGEQLLHIADSMHMPLQINLVDASPKFDVLPDKAIATRREIVEQAANDALRIMAYHFPYPGIGHIAANEDRFDWIP